MAKEPSLALRIQGSLPSTKKKKKKSLESVHAAFIYLPYFETRPASPTPNPRRG